MARSGADPAVVGEGRCSCTGLRKATRRISQLYDLALAPSGLKITQRAILAQTERSDPATIGTLAAALVMDPGALAHTLKPLERDGFVVLEVDPGDRRSRFVRLTSAGRAKLAETDVLWSRVQNAFEAALGGEHSQALQVATRAIISDEFARSFEQHLNLAEPSRRDGPTATHRVRPRGGRSR